MHSSPSSAKGHYKYDQHRNFSNLWHETINIGYASRAPNFGFLSFLPAYNYNIESRTDEQTASRLQKTHPRLFFFFFFFVTRTQSTHIHTFAKQLVTCVKRVPQV